MEIFEEQAIESAPLYKPKIWKRYVDDTFTILDRYRVDFFPQHLNSQQPSIRFTMEIENNNKIAFLETSVYREPDSRLTTSVYRKPAHTDPYLAYDSHHPQSVKRGILKCLYDPAGLTSRNQFLKHGCPRSKYANNRRTVQQRTTEGTATRRSNGRIECTSHSRPCGINDAVQSVDLIA